MDGRHEAPYDEQPTVRLCFGHSKGKTTPQYACPNVPLVSQPVLFLLTIRLALYTYCILMLSMSSSLEEAVVPPYPIHRVLMTVTAVVEAVFFPRVVSGTHYSAVSVESHLQRRLAG